MTQGRGQLERRQRLADAAARLMAEHGIRDYGQAKRKAARQLGLAESEGMPSNEEVDAALRERQSLYDPEEQRRALEELRREALEAMSVFERFEPVLTGPVASGAVSEHSLIELEISAESSKDFEQFLVNRAIEFKIQDRSGHMGYLLYAEPADIHVRLVAAGFHAAGAAQRPRVSRQQLARMMAAAAESA